MPGPKPPEIVLSGDERAAPERLADAPKPGAPARLTPEQVCQIIALACELPATTGRPISQWTGREVADEVVRARHHRPALPAPRGAVA